MAASYFPGPMPATAAVREFEALTSGVPARPLPAMVFERRRRSDGEEVAAALSWNGRGSAIGSPSCLRHAIKPSLIHHTRTPTLGEHQRHATTLPRHTQRATPVRIHTVRRKAPSRADTELLFHDLKQLASKSGHHRGVCKHGVAIIS